MYLCGNVLTLQFEYNEKNLLVRRLYGNGAMTSYEYQPHTNLIESIVNTFPNGSVASSFNYTYDGLGRPVALATEAGEWSMRYDKASQLIEWQSPDSMVRLTYDKNGNRIKTERDGAETGYAFNNLNQYTSVGDVELTYDDNGNVIQRMNPITGDVTEYEYDTENKVVLIRQGAST